MVGTAQERLCPPYKVSTERALQVEAAISRLLGRDRPVSGKQPPSEHVVAGAVDGFDADELPGFVAERGERPLRAIAAHRYLVIAGGQSHHLQLVGTLIAPEPRQTVVGLGVAGQPRRDATRVVGG